MKSVVPSRLIERRTDEVFALPEKVASTINGNRTISFRNDNKHLPSDARAVPIASAGCPGPDEDEHD